MKRNSYTKPADPTTANTDGMSAPPQTTIATTPYTYRPPRHVATATASPSSPSHTPSRRSPLQKHTAAAIDDLIQAITQNGPAPPFTPTATPLNQALRQLSTTLLQSRSVTGAPPRVPPRNVQNTPPRVPPRSVRGTLPRVPPRSVAVTPQQV